MNLKAIHLRYTNTAILVLMAVLTLTGVYGIFWTLNGWMFDVHRGAAWALLALIPWKAAISFRSLQRGLRPRFDRSVLLLISLVLAAAVLTILGLGLLWAWRVGPESLWLSQTLISWHWIIALMVIPVLALHAWRHWPRPKTTDFTTRRNAIRSLGLVGIGAIGWWAAETFAQSRATASAPRSITGSRGDGLLAGNQFPITGEWANPVDPSAWRLAAHGTVEHPQRLSYQQILALPHSELEANIDCTTGWYSTQRWQGVRLSDLLSQAAITPQTGYVRLKSITGYAATFTLDEAGEILLATHVGGQPLDHWHGFPLRAVAPSRRGWFWVKWLTDVEALMVPRFDLPGIF